MGTPTFERQEEDLEIIRRILRGEKESYARLVQAYQTDLFAKIYRWVGEQELAEDIAQEVFLKAFRNLKNFRGESKFSTWLFQIALNRCRDFWRLKKRRPKDVVPLEEVPGLAEPGNSADRELEHAQKVERLREALVQLPDTYRQTLALRFFDDLSCQEIAEATGQGLSNVKMRLMRGITKLKEKLKEGRAP